MRKVEFEPVMLGREADIFAIRFVDESSSEFEKFLLLFKDNKLYQNDMKSILHTIENIFTQGAKEYYFRLEGKVNDRLCAIPIFVSGDKVKNVGSLRLYCIRISDKLLIFGGGGIKVTATYQEDENLLNCVEILQRVDKTLYEMEKTGIDIYDKIINLSLEI